MDRDVTSEVALTVSQRDVTVMKERLACWLAQQVGDGTAPAVCDLRRPEGGGLSSVSVLFEATWLGGASMSLVARMPPEQTSFPIFPSYDLRTQYDVIAAVRACSHVPVPGLVGLDEHGKIAGEPMIVMERVAGVVPTDNPPCVFRGWLYGAAPERRRDIEVSGVAVLAGLHGIGDVDQRFSGLAAVAGDDPLRSHIDAQRAYNDWTTITDGIRVPLIERAFDWLEDHWPDDPAATVFSWGDAWIGNILYDGTQPAAVLDWEMAALGPRELDLAGSCSCTGSSKTSRRCSSCPACPAFSRATPSCRHTNG